MSYLRTRTARFLLSLRVNTQDINRERFKWVPALDWGTRWTDELLAQRWGLTAAEVAHIAGKIKEWRLTSGKPKSSVTP